MEILSVVNSCIEKTVDKLIAIGGSVNDIAAVGNKVKSPSKNICIKMCRLYKRSDARD